MFGCNDVSRDSVALGRDTTQRLQSDEWPFNCTISSDNRCATNFYRGVATKFDVPHGAPGKKQP